MAAILCSIQTVRTDRLTFCTLTRELKFSGNLVDLRALLRARESLTDAVPLIDGIVEVSE